MVLIFKCMTVNCAIFLALQPRGQLKEDRGGSASVSKLEFVETLLLEIVPEVQLCVDKIVLLACKKSTVHFSNPDLIPDINRGTSTVV